MVSSKSCWITCYTHHSLLCVSVRQEDSALRKQACMTHGRTLRFYTVVSLLRQEFLILFKMKVLYSIMLLEILIVVM